MWVTAAAANMAGVRGGFLTNYGADLSQPAWLYMVLREQRRWWGESPARTALLVWGGAVASEVCQLYWPRGMFRGTFDPWDLVAFTVSVGSCLVAEKCGRVIEARRR